MKIKVVAKCPGIAQNHMKDRGMAFDVEEEMFAPEWMERIDPVKAPVSVLPEARGFMQRVKEALVAPA